MKVIIEPEIFKAICSVAPKDDVRYYLNGFYIDHERLQIVATSGSILVAYPIPLDNLDADKSVILTIPARMPKKSCSQVVIESLGDRFTVTYLSPTGQDTQLVDPVDGTYPDYARMLVDKNRTATPISAVSFNPLLITPVCKALGAAHVHTYHFASATESIDVTFKAFPDMRITLMPCRL